MTASALPDTVFPCAFQNLDTKCPSGLSPHSRLLSESPVTSAQLRALDQAVPLESGTVSNT